MADEYHYPPDLLELLVEALARLNKGKKGVIIFLRGAGVDEAELADVDEIVRTSPGSINAYFSPSWTAFQADRGRDFSVIVDGVSV